MALLGSRASFVPYVLKHSRNCPECGALLQGGWQVLASIKDSKVKKIVCTDECRQTFDARLWEEFARKNAKRRRKG